MLSVVDLLLPGEQPETQNQINQESNMAFSISGLYQIGPGGNGPRMWLYNTTDTKAVVTAADYFALAANELQVNDTILCVSSTGGTPVIFFTYVNQNDGTIDVVNGLDIPATDT